MIFKKFWKNYWFLFLIAGLVILLDQVSKAYIRAAFTGPEGAEMWAPWPWLLPYARIIHITNTGVAFGMLQGLGGIFTILALLVALSIIYYFPRVPAEDWVLRLSMSLMLGGALGNLIDRVTMNGKVTDFISIGNFPVFNIADSSITIGVIVLIIGVWVQENREKAAQLARDKDDPTHDANPAALDADPPSQDSRSG